MVHRKRESKHEWAWGESNSPISELRPRKNGIPAEMKSVQLKERENQSLYLFRSSQKEL